MFRDPLARWLPLAIVTVVLALGILLVGSTGLVLANDGPSPRAFPPDEPPPAQFSTEEPTAYPVVGLDVQPAQGSNLVLNVNYRHDWVEGLYPLGHTVWLTVTDNVGNVKSTIELQTQTLTHWLPTQPSGFSSQLGGQWQPVPPDIQPGDWVHGRTSLGATGSTQIGEITGVLNVAADTLNVTVNAPWFTQNLNAYCINWATGIQIDFSINPNGGTHLCDFGAAGDDLLPGQNIAVGYIEPDFDRVINVFIEPVPDLRMEKWAPGSGLSMPGGRVVYALRYRNDGDQVASGIDLVDTLPANTTYLADSSGLAANVAANSVSWNPPALAPGESDIFYLALESTATLGDILTNQAEISVPLDPIPGNNTASANVSVVDGAPNLFVGTNPNPVDPAPGQTMLWYIDYGNDGIVASGEATLTDTLPPGTTVVDWWSDGYYNLWEEVSRAGGQLVLRVPSIPGSWRDRITVRLQLDPGLALGTQLTNSVEITTAGDSNPANNTDTYVWSSVGQPRSDVAVRKTLNWGTFVPGGQISYFVYVDNLGNMPADVTLTDLLPLGTTFESSWLVVLPTRQSFPPDSANASQAVWNLGTLQPGDSLQIEIRLTIDVTATTGAAVYNCAEVSIPGGDSQPANDRSCYSETVEETGPNLQVDKDCWWNATNLIVCQVTFRNLGTTVLQDLVFTDALPENTSFGGDWWHYFWQPINLNHNPATNQIVWQIAELQQTWASQLYYVVVVDPSVAGQQGLAFSNTVSAPVAGDVDPADNQATATALTGPDLYVTKRISSGTVQPGGTIVFTIEYGNRNVWPWDTDPNFGVRVVDTLPAGVTYVSSTAPSPPTITGQQLEWHFDSLPARTSQQFQVTVQLPDPLSTDVVLVNQVEVYSTSPLDVEYNLANNVFHLPLAGDFHRIYLPMVFRELTP
jgi:uncharacterized repeat protein (TIGR01451 family)